LEPAAALLPAAADNNVLSQHHADHLLLVRGWCRAAAQQLHTTPHDVQ
jgi:hypothetical protein